MATQPNQVPQLHSWTWLTDMQIIFSILNISNFIPNMAFKKKNSLLWTSSAGITGPTTTKETHKFNSPIKKVGPMKSGI